MPNNYIIGSDTDDEGEILRKISAAVAELERMAQKSQRWELVYCVHEGGLADIQSKFVNYGFNRFARSTKPFFAEDNCNEYGLCARNCPAHAITLREAKPAWAAQCYPCMRRINECPQQAVPYGKATVGRRRYTIRAYPPRTSNEVIPP